MNIRHRNGRKKVKLMFIYKSRGIISCLCLIKLPIQYIFNKCIHRLENLIILFTKQYTLQNKITSRLSVNITKKPITKRIFMGGKNDSEKLQLLYICMILIGKVIFQCLKHSCLLHVPSRFFGIFIVSLLKIYQHF